MWRRRRNEPDVFENLANPPQDAPGALWLKSRLWGLVVASILIGYGSYACIAQRAWFFNILRPRDPRFQPGLLLEVTSWQAVGVGVMLIGAGLFLHFHWWWSQRKFLSRFHGAGKSLSLVVFIFGLGWWILALMK